MSTQAKSRTSSLKLKDAPLMTSRLLTSIVFWLLQSACSLAQPISVEVITDIRPVSVLTFQAGMKSHQTVQLDLKNSTASQTFETGITNLLGLNLESIRDSFKIVSVVREGRSVLLSLKGQTASAVMVMPDIDYEFTLRFFLDTGAVHLLGCHNSYPSYTVRIGGVIIYDREQTGTAMGGLMGTCDVEVDKTERFRPNNNGPSSNGGGSEEGSPGAGDQTIEGTLREVQDRGIPTVDLRDTWGSRGGGNDCGINMQTGLIISMC